MILYCAIDGYLHYVHCDCQGIYAKNKPSLYLLLRLRQVWLKALYEFCTPFNVLEKII